MSQGRYRPCIDRLDRISYKAHVCPICKEYTVARVGQRTHKPFTPTISWELKTWLIHPNREFQIGLNCCGVKLCTSQARCHCNDQL
jgi:hypothetical protein